ncbi:MAG: type II and III secretion system protein [Verrucomicrobia bacterium]|nr:MAG: type II and III secretion system protein [Verrucomicrobiota bacterium]
MKNSSHWFSLKSSIGPNWSRLLAAALAPIICTVALAQNTNAVAEREAARRQAALPRGQEALGRAKAAMAEGNFTVAHEEFRLALTFLPDAVISEKSHDEALSGFCASGMKLAEQKVAEGKYGEAEGICREILSNRYDPNCRPAAEMLARLQAPGTVNRTMGPKFLSKVEEVKKLLVEAEGYYMSGRYDLAFKKYEQVLAIDPYNVAARRGEERLDLTKTHYGEEAYNETRSRQLWQVQKGWEEPVKKYGETVGPITDAFAKDATGTARITTKLNTIIIPKIEFRDASIREAIEFLRQQAAENDPGADGRKGVDIVLRLNTLGTRAETTTTTSTVVSSTSAAPGVSPEPTAIAPPPPPVPTTVSAPSINPADARITITLNQIPLGEALRYIASQANLKVKVEPYAVSIIPISELSNDLLTKQYRVPPGFISGSLNASGSALNQPAANSKTAAQTTGTAKDTQESTGGRLLVNREGAKEFLESQGVSFSVPGSSANFLPQSSRLIVRNTADMLELVDAIVEQANVSGPKQVEIEAKFIEITQNNLKAMGFDWLLGPFNLNKSGEVAVTGGTSGTGSAVNPVDYPTYNPPLSTTGLNPVTAGNRSGNLSISGNAIDSLLLGTTTTQLLSPGIFGFGGLLTDPQFQVVVRALNQKKGVDLLSAPRVTTKSGQRAVIEIVREFRYPTQFQPPQIPQTVGTVRNDTSGLTGNLIPLGSTSTVPVTPTTPTAFETRNTGVTLEVEPVVGPDGVTIDLNLVPQVVEFEGFINYGSPIFSPSTSFLDTLTNIVRTTPQNVITPNVINQPIFSTRKVTTSVSVWDGQTVVLGGLMREDVQKTEDRTPIIGDIPIVGRLFRTNVEQHIKRNLIIFVTARLINPGGQPVNATEEVEESENVIEPPILPEVPFYKK